MYIVSKYKIYSHKFKKQEEKQEQVSVSVSRRVPKTIKLILVASLPSIQL